MITLKPTNSPLSLIFKESTLPYCYTEKWYNLYKNVFDYEVRSSVLYNGNDIIGGISYVILKSIILGNRMISLPFTDDAGIFIKKNVILNNCEQHKIQCLISNTINKELRSNNLSYAEFRGGFPLYKKEGHNNFNIVKKTPYKRFILDLTPSLEKITGCFNSNILKNLKKAKKNILISQCKDIKMLPTIYEIYIRQIKLFGSPPLPYSYFKYFFNDPKSMFFIAVFNNKTIGFLLIHLNNKTVYSDINGSLSNYDKFFPKVMLYYKTIEFAKMNDFIFFDFMRTRINSGVYFHKKKWGGKESNINYYFHRSSKFSNINFDGSQKRFFLIRKIIAFTPNYLLQKFGPLIRKTAGK